MKKVYSLLILVFLLTNQLYADNTKQELIEKANSGDVGAMVSLNKMIYAFPENKEGLQYYNKWYKLITKNTKTEDIIKFAKVYGKYKNMFINGNLKYEKILNFAKDKGSKEALFMLLNLYGESSFIYPKKLKIKDTILKNATKEDYERVLDNFDVSYEENIYNEILNEMQKKFPSKKEAKDFVKLQNAFSKSKKDIPKILNKILTSNNYNDIYQTAKYLKNKYGYKKEVTKFYEKALEKTKDNKIKAEILFYLGGVYFNPKNMKKSFKYFEEASSLHNKYATEQLLKLYRDKKYLKEYINLKKQLLSTKEGKKIFAEYIYKNHSKHYAYELFEQLATQGDNDSAITLALASIEKNSSYSFSPELFLLSQKWQDYILKQKNIKLLKDFKVKLSKKYQKRAKELIAIIDKKMDLSNNILELRILFEEYLHKDKKKALGYLNKAISFGDTNSSFELASEYLERDRKTNKAIKIYEELAQKGDLYAKTKLGSIYLGMGDFLTGSKIKKEKGIKYLKETSDKNYDLATENLVYYYMCKSCSSSSIVDYKKAKLYIDKLIPKNDPFALYRLAYLYDKGLGVKEDKKKALQLYEKAFNLASYISLDRERSALNIGLIYKEGKNGIKKDLDLAKTWFKKSNSHAGKIELKELEKGQK